MVAQTVLGVALAVLAALGIAAAWLFGRRDGLVWFTVGLVGGFVLLLMAVFVLTSPPARPGDTPNVSPAPPVASGSFV